MLGLIIQKLVVVGNWVIEVGQTKSPRSTGFRVREAEMLRVKWLLLKLRKKLDLYTDDMISPDKSS